MGKISLVTVTKIHDDRASLIRGAFLLVITFPPQMGKSTTENCNFSFKTINMLAVEQEEKGLQHRHMLFYPFFSSFLGNIIQLVHSSPLPGHSFNHGGLQSEGRYSKELLKSEAHSQLACAQPFQKSAAEIQAVI